MSRLRERLASGRILMAPGVYDALGAAAATEAGFEALYLTGAGLSYSRLGRSDLGLLTMTEMAETVARIADRSDLPLIADGDTGFGNALNVIRTVRSYETAGAAAIQLEDQAFPKRCGHLPEKRLVPVGEMVGKIRAATDTRKEMLVIARTDAIAVEGFDAALERGARYVEAGADILFVEAPRSEDQMRQLVQTFGARCPLMANMVEGGHTPLLSADELQATGFALAIWPGGVVRAVLHHMQRYYASLRATGSNAAFAAEMLDFGTLNRILGLDEMMRLSEDYGGHG